MEPFIVGIDITSTKDLFGKNREIETFMCQKKRKRRNNWCQTFW